MTDTKDCDTCDQPMLVFANFETSDTCSECLRRLFLIRYPDVVKVAEWLNAMEWLDEHQAPAYVGEQPLPLVRRLEKLWDER